MRLDDQPSEHETGNEPVRLIVGMSRAGTTWVTKELSRHPDVISYGETMLWGRMYRPPTNPDGTDTLEDTKQRIALSVKHFADYVDHAKYPERRERYESSKLGHIPIDILESITTDLRASESSCEQPMTPAQVFMQMNHAVCVHTHAKIAIESTPNHLNFLDRIFEALPDAIVVAMLREPYAFMVSYKHQGDRKDAHAQRVFRRLYHPMFCAIVWRRYACSARIAMSQHTKHVRAVWLDELKRGGGESMRDLAAFLRIPDPEFFVREQDADTHKNTSFPSGKRPQLSHADMFWMNLIASREMKRHGLSKVSAGFHPIAVIGSVLRLPISAFHVFTIMRKNTGVSTFGYLRRVVFGK